MTKPMYDEQYRVGAVVKRYLLSRKKQASINLFFVQLFIISLSKYSSIAIQSMQIDTGSYNVQPPKAA